MWDVPSSVESSNGKKKKALTTYGKRRRSSASLAAGSPGAKIFGVGGEEGTPEQVVEDGNANVTGHGHGDDDNDGFAKPSPLPARKKAKVSLYDATAQDSTTFYIAQSNLTTMQKLQYQKVNVSANPTTGGPVANQPSSGVTTIAYSTPSIYASSGPPLPWERPAEPEQQEASQHVIDVSTSYCMCNVTSF